MVKAFVGIGPGSDTPDPHLTADSLVVATEAPYDDGAPKTFNNKRAADWDCPGAKRSHADSRNPASAADGPHAEVGRGHKVLVGVDP